MAVILEPDRREIARYLGYRSCSPDAAVQREIEYCITQLQEKVTPHYVYEKFPLSITDPENTETENTDTGNAGTEDVSAENTDTENTDTQNTDIKNAVTSANSKKAVRDNNAVPVIRAAGLEIRSRNLAGNLQGCTELYLMAATLGPAPDRLVKRASVTAMSRALIYQAAAAAMIESWCDEVCRRISLDAEKDGLYCRPRFSPGYGDVPLDLQKDFERILHMSKEIGVGLTDTLLMTPSKSVTAFIGASPMKQPCHVKGCEVCNLRDTCAYSRA